LITGGIPLLHSTSVVLVFWPEIRNGWEKMIGLLAEKVLELWEIGG
jgi:hypothetical protein